MTRSISSIEAPETRRINAFMLSVAGSPAGSASLRCRRSNATSRRTKSRISPSNAFVAAWSTSLSFSGGRRSGAYFSGPDFSGPSLSAPSRSGLMAVMVYSYTGATVALTLPRIDFRMRLRRPWGKARAASGRIARQILLALPIQLEAGGDALIAERLADIGHRGGDVQRAVQLLLGAEPVVGDRIGAGRGEAGGERGAGRQEVEFGDLLVVPDLRHRLRRRDRRRCRERAEGFGDRVAVLQRDGECAADRHRVLERGAELALIVARIDARIDRGEVGDSDRRPGGAAAVAGPRQRAGRLVAVG